MDGYTIRYSLYPTAIRSKPDIYIRQTEGHGQNSHWLHTLSWALLINSV